MRQVKLHYYKISNTHCRVMVHQSIQDGYDELSGTFIDFLKFSRQISRFIDRRVSSSG